jgi:hypothetical protein
MHHMHSTVLRMHFGYGPIPDLWSAMSEPVPMTARFPYMSSARHCFGELTARQPKLQDRRQARADLNQQALHNHGVSANHIVNCPVDPEPGHTTRERAKRPVAGKFNVDYVAASLQSNRAVACANRSRSRRPGWIRQQPIGSLAERRWSRIRTGGHRCPALLATPRKA